MPRRESGRPVMKKMPRRESGRPVGTVGKARIARMPRRESGRPAPRPAPVVSTVRPSESFTIKDQQGRSRLLHKTNLAACLAIDSTYVSWACDVCDQEFTAIAGPARRASRAQIAAAGDHYSNSSVVYQNSPTGADGPGRDGNNQPEVVRQFHQRHATSAASSGPGATPAANCSSLAQDSQQLANGQSCQIYLGNLAWEVDEAAVHAVFRKCGHITAIRWLHDKHGQFKGCGFATFATPEEAAAALELGQPMCCGRCAVLLSLAQFLLPSTRF